ncbi:unnamed protein product [Amoebophrya sp. A25]|nr:unnamed protein product [Amoebophrya sp. A25]|eukprot:GSA25T00013016001.1
MGPFEIVFTVVPAVGLHNLLAFVIHAISVTLDVELQRLCLLRIPLCCVGNKAFVDFLEVACGYFLQAALGVALVKDESLLGHDAMLEIPLLQGAIVLFVLWFFATPKAAIYVPQKAPEDPTGITNVKFEKGSGTGEGRVWTCDPKGTLPQRFAKEGPASKEFFPPCTVEEILQRAAQSYPDHVALAIERPAPKKIGEKKAPSIPWDQWTKWTYAEFYKESVAAAAAFCELGVEMHGAVAVWGFNSPEWHMTFAAAAIAGAKMAGVYPTDSFDNMVYKVKHSGARVAVVEGKKQVDTLLSAKVEGLNTIVFYDPEGGATEGEQNGVSIIAWKTLVSGKYCPKGEEAVRYLSKRRASLQVGHCCCLVYTSGTTGMPKAVMCSHDAITSTGGLALHELKNMTGKLKGPQRALSYLPLSHVAGLMLDIVAPMVLTARYPLPMTIYFARKYDMSEATIVERISFVRPTIFLGVPRVWEKLAEGMKAVGAKVKPPISWLSAWAKAKCLVHSRNCQLGGSGAYPLKWKVANLVTGGVRKKIGLDQLQFAFTGAAPMNPETFEYWGSLGVNIYELFAMSESTAICTISSPRAATWGSVGFACPGVEVKILNADKPGVAVPRAKDLFHPTEAEQGELCYRGRNSMMGYMANGAFGKDHVAELQKKTAEAIDPDGWIHSGDKACLSKNGMFRITGRYKELIITAGGENIAPVPIENWVQANFPAISNIMMVGDKKKYNTCLITLKSVGATGLEPGTDQLTPEASALLGGVKTISKARSDAAALAYCEKALKAVNAEASVVPSNACKIQKFKILPLDFSVEGEELTPTLKLKRSFVMSKYKTLIDEMY